MSTIKLEFIKESLGFNVHNSQKPVSAHNAVLLGLHNSCKHYVLLQETRYPTESSQNQNQDNVTCKHLISDHARPRLHLIITAFYKCFVTFH